MAREVKRKPSDKQRIRALELKVSKLERHLEWARDEILFVKRRHDDEDNDAAERAWG